MIRSGLKTRIRISSRRRRIGGLRGSSRVRIGAAGRVGPGALLLLVGTALHGADPEPYTQRIDGTVLELEMVPLPSGVVTLNDQEIPIGPVWIGRTEVTWDVFDAYRLSLDGSSGEPGVDAIARPSKPYISMDRGFGHGGYPAISMSYHSAKTFCTWLSKKTGRRYRLPAEAEWRHACALGGVDESSLEQSAWFFDNARFKTHAVASKAADALGLHDLHGNAAEWCTTAEGAGVTMGGNYRSDAEDLGCAARVMPSDSWNASDPQLPKSVWWLADAGFIGFRVVCEPDPPAAPAPATD